MELLRTLRQWNRGSGWNTSRQILGLMIAMAGVLVLLTFKTVGARLMRTRTPAAVAVPAPFPVWVESGLIRVGRSDAPGPTDSITLFGARGETVDSQIIVRAPASGLTKLNLTASALSGPAGATIPASSVTLYREHYLTVSGTANYGGGTNPPEGSGTYPEPLIPFNDPETGAPLCNTAAVLKACDASVSAGQNQPYWIDISVPRSAADCPPGTYTGTVSVTSRQGSGVIPVTLTVWNFELPLQPSELSVFSLWPPAAGGTVASLNHALMRNKVMGWYEPPTDAASDMTTFGLNRTGLDHLYPVQIKCKRSESVAKLPATGEINTAVGEFPPGLALDFYVADELNDCKEAYPDLKSMGMNAHAANSNVKTIMTVNRPDPNLYNEGDERSAIDHWVLLDSVEQWPELPFTGRGDLWSYTSCNTGRGNTPEWLVDYPPINERIQAGFLNFTQEAKGILYYRSDGWTNGNALTSWNSVDTTACGGGFGRPGDGIFVYPPGPIGSSEPAPGIRLKAIRDGIQDFEYAQLLKKLGHGSLVNTVLSNVAASWTHWTHDPTALENARKQLGLRLEQISTQPTSALQSDPCLPNWGASGCPELGETPDF